jgi:hypothetical protein
MKSVIRIIEELETTKKAKESKKKKDKKDKNKYEEDHKHTDKVFHPESSTCFYCFSKPTIVLVVLFKVPKFL